MLTQRHFTYWVRSNVVGTTTWSVTPSVGYVSAPGEYTFTLSSGQFADFAMNTSNTCGTSSLTVRFRATLSGFKVYPNPATDHISVEANSGDRLSSTIKEIALFSESSLQPVFTVFPENSRYSDASKIDINVENFPRGKYFIHISQKDVDEPEKFQIILK